MRRYQNEAVGHRKLYLFQAISPTPVLQLLMITPSGVIQKRMGFLSSVDSLKVPPSCRPREVFHFQSPLAHEGPKYKSTSRFL